MRSDIELVAIAFLLGMAVTGAAWWADHETRKPCPPPINKYQPPARLELHINPSAAPAATQPGTWDLICAHSRAMGPAWTCG